MNSMFKKKAKKHEPVVRTPDQLTKALEVLFASEYIDKRKLYFNNFVRGITFGAGGVIGATVVVGLLVWILSIFDTLPLIGPLFDDTKQTIEKRDK